MVILADISALNTATSHTAACNRKGDQGTIAPIHRSNEGRVEEDERSEEAKISQEAPRNAVRQSWPTIQLRCIICAWLPFVRQDDQNPHPSENHTPKPAFSRNTSARGQHSRWMVSFNPQIGGHTRIPEPTTFYATPPRLVACLTMPGRICPAAGLNSALRRFLYHGRIRIRANRRYCCIYPPGPGPYIRCLFSGRSSPMLSGIRWMGGVPTCGGNPPRCIPPGVRTIWGPLTPPPAVMYPPASRFGDA